MEYKSDTLITYRKEKKYYINVIDYYNISNRISKIFPRDPNGGKENTYHVRSLYFDNKSDKDYFDKIDGIEKRKKFRIRIYNHSTTPVKMEKKSKTDKYIKKESFLIDSSHVDKIINGDYRSIGNHKNTAAAEIYYEFMSDYYRPVIIIDYIREAYMYDINHIRITFDKDIKKSEVNVHDLFNKDQDMDSVINNKKVIMEIKFNGFLPHWIKNVLQLPRFENCAISKYTLSRYLKG